jgi:hypothetical protein
MRRVGRTPDRLGTTGHRAEADRRAGESDGVALLGSTRRRDLTQQLAKVGGWIDRGLTRRLHLASGAGYRRFTMTRHP